MSSNATTAREALMAELLQDVDALASRIESADQRIGERIEQAVKDGASRALLAARMAFEQSIAEQERRLVEAGKHGAALIGNQLNSRTADLIQAAATRGHHTLRLVAILAAVAVVAGVLGGYLGAYLSLH